MCVLALFYGNNEIVLQHSKRPADRKDDFSAFEVVTGLEADIFESPDMSIEETSHPDEVFVHAGTLSAVLGCTVQTARNRLEELEEHGIVYEHGDAPLPGQEGGMARLFRPTLDSPEEFIAAADELAGTEPVTSADELQEVMPSDFEHLGDGIWRYKQDGEVTVDVTKPEHDSIRQSIRDQLSQHGLVPTSMRNFQHQLRSKAGLT